MGVVYRAYDTLMNRNVALKTILDVENLTALDLFYKEWGVQATIVHPNIAEIYDIGEFLDDGVAKPFFVMPLLPGTTLDGLIRDGSAALTVERSIGIICQAARGLQAAHEHGLVHRDLKPSNIFVMQDDSVKIIDFGVAHLVTTGAKTSLKGTLTYMAPEQLEMKAPSPLTDIFSLAVVCYQTLTRRLPFTGNSEYEITEAILRHSPPPISEINSQVNDAISSVVHKAMAKRPWHRFPSAKEFSDSLQKALHNQPLEFLDAEKINPRIETAIKAFGEGDYNFASEVLFELEAEGHLDPRITLTRRQLDQAIRKTTIRQLLGSARRFLEAKEYGLALRKTQEALDLDDHDADVLAFKNQVEKEQREKQIDEWLRLAKQHVENKAFGQARQAIESVLKLKPNDTVALGLATEIERLERELVRDREEKKKLYQAAMEAWQRGEVSASLSRLELLVSLERDRPDSEGDRSGAYQKFYQQVRSEHDASKNAYEEARTHLGENNFSAARAICDQFLAKYPSHALFQALKVELEERQRQQMSAFIAQTDQRVDDEPDVDRRLGILEEALKIYPGEPHFERAIHIVREKRDLVNSIVSKACFYEEKAQFNEALDQWQILKSIHSRYPGLDLEIERLTKRRDQQARTQAKARWGEQIDQHLESGQYDRAVDVCQSALAEFPDDAALLELEKLARKDQERSKEAMTALSQGRELCEKGQFEAGLDLLRSAHQLDERSAVARTVLLNHLTSRARQLVDSDWQGAEKLVTEILALDPANSPAQSLRTQVEDHKREDFVSQCVAEARRLQGEGNLPGARAAVEKGLASYPEEPRLKQLLGTVTRAQTGTTRITNAGTDLRQLQQIEKEAVAGVPPARAVQLAEEVKTIAARHPEDESVQQLVAQLRGQLSPIVEKMAAELPTAAPSVTAPPKTAKAAAGAAAATKPAPELKVAPSPGAKPKKPAAPAKGAQPGAPKSSTPKRPWAFPLPSNPRQRMLLAAGAGTVVVLLIVAVALFRGTGGETPAGPGLEGVQVALRSEPPAAAIWIAGKQCGIGSCDIDLAAGSYQAEARLLGYQTAVVSFEVSASQTEQKSIALMLEPMAPALYLSSDLESGAVLLDGQPAGKLEDGEFQLDGLAAGEHTLEITGSGSRAAFTLEIRPGSIPVVHDPIETRSLKAAAVSSLGGGARVYVAGGAAAAFLDGGAANPVPPDGLELRDLAEGTHEITLGAGKDQLNVAFQSSAVPSLAVFLKSDRNVGGLRLETKEDGATVYINGQPYRRKTQRGRLLVYLVPRNYTVRVEKEGFEPSAEQTIEVVRGEEVNLTFNLAPLPQTAVLIVRNAPPGAEVIADGVRLGAIPANADTGTFRLPAGNHTVSLRKESYKPKELRRDFKAGETVELDGALASASGVLQIEVEPAGVKALLTLRREGETAERPVTETTLTLPEGNYTAIARADGYQEFAATIRVVAEQTKVARLTLHREPTVSSRSVDLLQALRGTPGWAQEGNLLTRRGGEYVTVPQEPVAGIYQFTILLQSGRRIEWVVNFQNEKDHVLIQMDGSHFNRIEVIDGKRGKPVRVRHEVDRDNAMTVRVDVSSDRIVHYLFRNQQWVVLDNWQPSEISLRSAGGKTNFLQGRFGFRVPSRDKIGISSFTFTPR
jgi:serine/threonine-protein kinase